MLAILPIANNMSQLYHTFDEKSALFYKI